ncbi:hypothetical protein ACKA06_09245 [Rossellomorea oryzaecorticis]|uniref:Uncharacterized protein n=1 Tax=Rossellomorea oryzaecorticis TaxID=1396505 RepID=A0ABW8VPM1_9BACI
MKNGSLNIDRSFPLQAFAFRGEEVEPPRRSTYGLEKRKGFGQRRVA